MAKPAIEKKLVEYTTCLTCRAQERVVTYTLTPQADLRKAGWKYRKRMENDEPFWYKSTTPLTCKLCDSNKVV